MPLFVAMAGLLGEEAALGLARVAGASVARFAEAVSMALRSTVADLSLDNTGSEAATARTYAGLAAMAPAAGRALDTLLRHHLDTARRQFELTDSNDVVPLGQVRAAVAFADMTGFTELSQVASAQELARLLGVFEDAASETVQEADGRVVKFIGDAVMYVTPRADAAVGVATRLVERMRATAPVRAGVAFGVLLAQDGDYYGPKVNLAARLVAAAEPGEVLVDGDANDRLDGAHETVATPPRALRGIAEPVVAYAVR